MFPGGDIDPDEYRKLQEAGLVSGPKPDCDDELEREDGVGEDEGRTTHECLSCGYKTEIQTPQITVPHFCQGDCGSWSRFERITS